MSCSSSSYLTVDIIASFRYGLRGDLDDELGQTHVLHQTQHLKKQVSGWYLTPHDSESQFYFQHLYQQLIVSPQKDKF